MKRLWIVCTLFIGALTIQAQNNMNFYSFTVTTIDGRDLVLSELRGKKVLVVNTASKCGLTPQFEQLEALYRQYGDKGFVVIGFPANNFLNQEPLSNGEIIEFCKKNYGVTFPMMAKISVKGKDMHPLYQWLTSKEKNGKMDSEVQWNFQKYLIDENGNLVDVVPPRVRPDDEKIVKWITGKL
ncbi:MAG: glutathione peroxidase [Bacteroidales bacterium]